MRTPLVIRHYAKTDILTPECGRPWLPLQVLTGTPSRVNCDACLALLKQRVPS